jgi:hypothetical protein
MKRGQYSKDFKAEAGGFLVYCLDGVVIFDRFL